MTVLEPLVAEPAMGNEGKLRFSLEAVKALLESRAILACLFVIFSAIYGVLAFGHVFWRDEAMPLLIVQGNSHLADFFQAMRYEGTPALWHSLLWLASKVVSLTPLSASVIHFVFVEAFLVLVLFVLPIPLLYRVLILLLEPSVWNAYNARQYQIAAGCILLFGAATKMNRHRSLVLALSLAFLMQTCVHSMIIAGAFWLFWMVDEFRKTRRIYQPTHLLVALSLVLAGLQLSPPGDLMRGLRDWYHILSWQRGIESLVAMTTVSFLQSAWAVTGFLIIIGTVFHRAYTTNRTRAVMALFCLGSIYAAFFLITYAKLSGQRHFWLFSYAMIALLIALYEPGRKRNRLSAGFDLLMLILSLSFFSGSASTAALALKSESKNAAEFLDRSFPTDTVLSKCESFEAPIRLYRLTHPPEFALGRQAYVEHTVWNHSSVDFVSNPRAEHVYLTDVEKDLLRTDKSILDANPVVILSGFNIIDDLPKRNSPNIPMGTNYELVFVKCFQKAVEEKYVVFKLRRRTR